MIRSNTVIADCQTIQPVDVLPLFDDYDSHWDDDTEVNYQFVKKNTRIEFSWHWRDNILVPNYISVEKENSEVKI